jgi:hypothetical protein
VALRLPDDWARSPEFIAEADATFESALRNSTRVNAILVLWDEWVPALPHGMACLTRFRIYVNSAPREPFPDLERVLKAITIPEG